MTRPSLVLPVVGVLLLSASGILIWQNVGRSSPSPGSKLPEATAQSTRSRNAPPTRQADQKVPGNRSRTSSEKQDIEQINEWLDAHPDHEVKFSTATVGDWTGKLKEPNLIVQVWV